MTASILFKGLLASAATVASIGVAVAQGTPPTPNAANPAMGAGQRSTMGTPMGTTGTPATRDAGSSAAGTVGTTGAGAATPGTGTMGATGAATDIERRTTTTTQTEVDVNRIGQAGADGQRMRADRN